MAWQPIETAPHDGSVILTYYPRAPAHNQIVSDYYGRNWYRDDHKLGAGWAKSRSDNPTHWMPLPKPPTPEYPDNGE